MFQNCLFVMFGGALGDIMRYGVSRLCADISLMSMPIATFLVNIIGCFILGILTGVGELHSCATRGIMLMFTVGMCGAFTTFSTFSGETIKAMENGHIVSAIIYVASSVSIGLLMFWLGKTTIIH